MMKLLERLMRDPEAEELREQQLATAQVQLAEYEELSEYYVAMRDMLAGRVQRLEKHCDHG